MRRIKTKLASAIALAAALSASQVQALVVNANITTDTTWTPADNPVMLDGPIFVLNGASLTIEAGTIVASLVPDNGGLTVTRGCQIFVLGTKDNPVIMTSAEDVATWTGSSVTRTIDNVNFPEYTVDGGVVTAINTVGDPKTGVWRLRNNEWRNLTILGRGVISASHFGGVPVAERIGGGNNPTVPDGTAQRTMEGLLASDAGGVADNVRFGGADDEDDSGSICYLSIRYTGRVLGTGNELNGISLGAIGQNTDLRYIDIMNNVDDGIEIWGGKFTLRNVNIWNIGDDSLDMDEGFRGRIQFGLIVQGLSHPSNGQGSGTGDNCIEFDGAEDSSTQPYSTFTAFNLTVIGQPFSGDGATAWRDNANGQFHKCVFMDIGEELVRYDHDDADGQSGYGAGGTMNFADRWATAFDAFGSTAFTVNAGAGAFAPTAAFYSGQYRGTLCDIRDSVVYNLSNFEVDGTYDSGDAAGVGDVVSGQGAIPMVTTASVGVLNGTIAGGFSGNPAKANVLATGAAMPITSITRGADAHTGSLNIRPVTSLNPLPANDALACEELPGGVIDKDPGAGVVEHFDMDLGLTPAPFRGAFAPGNNWARGWTAADAYGFLTGDLKPEPEGEIIVTPTLSFEGELGCLYLVECSTDNKVWMPAAVVEGKGAGMPISYSDVKGFDKAKFYRACPL